MTPSELKYQIEQHGTVPHFFSRKTMRFFGDTMRNYGVASDVVNGTPVWVLYRKRPVKCGLQSRAFFSKANLTRVFEVAP